MLVAKIRTYDDFWPFYLGQHSQRGTRTLHAIGSAVALFCHLVCVPLTFQGRWILLGYIIGYAFAWYSHHAIEKNRPATFIHPYWSFFGDLELLSLILVDLVEPEVVLMQEAPQSPVSSPRRGWRWFLRLAIPGYYVLVGACWYSGLIWF